ncbi:MAG: ABC transporter ATP-binding protein [Bacilli bacterium]
MLQLKDISLTLNNKEILKDISLDINNNELLVITGPNGSGKTTLSKLIMGIYTPDKGKIIFNNEDITHTSVPNRSKKGISYSFQTPIVFKELTVKDILSIASDKNLETPDIKYILSRVGLCAKEYENRTLSSSLSGGEAKRIEIASILCKESSLLIFDEPESGIDLWSFNFLIKIFKDLKKDKSKTIIIVSHNKQMIDIADKILLMEGGRAVYYGKKENIKLQHSLCSTCKGESYE